MARKTTTKNSKPKAMNQPKIATTADALAVLEVSASATEHLNREPIQRKLSEFTDPQHHIRQGDVILHIPPKADITTIRRLATVEERQVVQGSTMGSRHRIDDRTVVKKNSENSPLDGDYLLVEPGQTAVLSHPEHASAEVTNDTSKPVVMQVTFPRDFEMEEISRAKD